ncbi:hypothetical protein CFOL_v3_16202, partial [Cephalotus follicularis]
AKERHAIAMDVARASAAEAAVATAQAAVELCRLNRAHNACANANANARENYAAVVIQTAFRGYLSVGGEISPSSTSDLRRWLR